MQNIFSGKIMRIKITIAVIIIIMSMISASAAQEKYSVSEAIRLTDYGIEAALKGLWSEATIRWEQALLAHPYFPAAHNNLAVAYEHLGKYDLARKHYEIAKKCVDDSRYLNSNLRMFRQFYYKYVAELESKEQRLARLKSGQVDPETGEKIAVKKPEIKEESEEEVVIAGPIYSKTGSQTQVFIKHPKRETEISGKYKSIYFAGFTPLSKSESNLNFETSEYLRSELRKHSGYKIVPLDELSLPSDEDEFDRLIDDYEFWNRLGSKVGSDLIIYGTVKFDSEPSDGYYPYEAYDRRAGDYRTRQMYIRRTAFSVELELFFQDTSTGELVHNESFGQTIVYRGRLDLTLQSFYDVMSRVVPRFLDLMVPREHDAIRFLIYG